ncbi:MAG: S9 family peptidase [Chthonomonas sp.]|nr:S9 family peptidase [Chthonomonas sp.]
MVTSILAALAVGSTSLAPTNKNINFDDLFPRQSWFGKMPQNMSWSEDGRYLTYTWNAYEEPVADLWLYDAKEGKARRLTSMEIMQPFDKDIPQAMVRYRQEKVEQDKLLTLGDAEWRDALQKRKEEAEARARRGDRQPSYGAFSPTAWSKTSDEFMFTYKGDLYRWKVADKLPTRITKTRDQEAQPVYSEKPGTFYFRRDDGIYRARFDSVAIEQLNPELPNNMSVGGYALSPDETKVALEAGRPLPGGRQVDYITYRDRFAQAQRTQRDVADDPFRFENYVYVVDLGPSSDEKPWEVFAYKGGDDLMVMSMDGKPWSADSKKLVFSTYSRNTKDVKFQVADTGTKKVATVYQTKQDGEENTAGMVSPFYIPDGRVIAMLENSGYRHAWIVDPISQGAQQLTTGDFEVIPVGLSKDGKTLFVRSSSVNPANGRLEKVDVATGKVTPLAAEVARYSAMSLSLDGGSVAMIRATWNQPRELVVRKTEEGAAEKVLTKSHRDGFAEKYNKLQPSLFDFKNRNGQTVHGYVMLPPGMKPGEKRPLFMYVYGGPLGTDNSVQNGDFNSTAYAFAQYLTLELGYITATVDPRGSSGYGAAFGKANFNNPGVPQVEDLSDAVKYLDATYGVDRERVGINGWSFGGFQTQMCLYTAPDVFTLGIAGAGPTQWQNYNNWYTGNTITRSPIGDPKPADAFSLTKMVKGLRSPLFLLHGMEDTNVLFQDTVKVYQELLRAGKGPLVELGLDPTGGHGMGGDMSNRDRHLMYLAFILKHWERK